MSMVGAINLIQRREERTRSLRNLPRRSAAQDGKEFGESTEGKENKVDMHDAGPLGHLYMNPLGRKRKGSWALNGRSFGNIPVDHLVSKCLDIADCLLLTPSVDLYLD